MTKEGYIRNQKIIQNRLMRAYIQPVQDSLDRQIEPFIHLVQGQGVETALHAARNSMPHNPWIGPVVTALYRDAAKQAEPKLRIQKQEKLFAGFGFLSRFVKDVLVYFGKYIFEKVILPIAKTTLDNIESKLEEAIQEGWGIDRTVAELKTMEISRSRARTIVRTESVRAMNYSQLRAAADENYEVDKQWIAIEDTRTRLAHTHLGVDGERVGLQEEFSNGLLFPGDPEGPPEQTINCRCTLGYFYQTDLNGKLVPKKNPADILANV